MLDVNIHLHLHDFMPPHDWLIRKVHERADVPKIVVAVWKWHWAVKHLATNKTNITAGVEAAASVASSYVRFEVLFVFDAARKGPGD